MGLESRMLNSQLSQLFDSEVEIDVLREKFKYFSEEELEAALEQAQAEVAMELKDYRVVEVENLVTKTKNVIKSQLNSLIIHKPLQDDTSTKLKKVDTDVLKSSSENTSDSDDASDGYSDDHYPETKDLHFRPRPLFTTPPKSPTNPTPEISNSVVKTNQDNRMLRLVRQFEDIFQDIFTALEVNRNIMAPRNNVEVERSVRRVKEFNCRLGRGVYQAKQTYSSLKSQLAKIKLARGSEEDNRKGSYSTSNRIINLLTSCRQMLVSYLHFLPLSGGQLFPLVLTDIMELLIDITSLAADLGINTGDITKNIRNLEQLTSQQQHKSMDDNVIRNLAKSLLGNPDSEQHNRHEGERRKYPLLQPDDNTSVHSKPKKFTTPKSTIVTQSRTNLARMRRLQGQGLSPGMKNNMYGREDSQNLSSEFVEKEACIQQRKLNNLNSLINSNSKVDKKMDTELQGLVFKQFEHLDSSIGTQTLGLERKQIPHLSTELLENRNATTEHLPRHCELPKNLEPRCESPALAKILKRIHNLEILAAGPAIRLCQSDNDKVGNITSGESNENENKLDSTRDHFHQIEGELETISEHKKVETFEKEKGTSPFKHKETDNLPHPDNIQISESKHALGHLLNRLEIIHSDINHVSQKYSTGYDRVMDRWHVGSGNRTRKMLRPVPGGYNQAVGAVTSSMVEDVVNKISQEILDQDLVSNLRL